MIRRTTLLFTIIGLLMLAACQPDVEEAQVDFCQALDNYHEAVAPLKEINENTTIDELNAMRSAVSVARDELLDAAGTLRKARLRYAEDAWSNLEKELDGIPGDATLGQAANYARIEIATLLTEIDRVTNRSCGRR